MPFWEKLMFIREENREKGALPLRQGRKTQSETAQKLQETVVLFRLNMVKYKHMSMI